MNILLIDHAWRRKSHSFDFLRETLEGGGHDVDVFYYERHWHCDIPDNLLAKADVLVFLEFLPFRFRLGVPGKICVFVPMYDNEWGSKWLWRRIAMARIPVISFCGRVTSHAAKCGVRKLLDVRYACNPADFPNAAGNPRIAIFWDRGQIPPSVLESIFPAGALDRIIVVRKGEEAHSAEAIPTEINGISVESVESSFLPREEYLRRVREPGVFIAPRWKEGIGLPLIENLAMGKCVIAHDDATMNEYLENGRNGIVMDMHRPRLVSAEEIAHVREGAAKCAPHLCKRWETDNGAILRFFEELAPSDTCATPWGIRLLFAYGLYMAEGAMERIRTRLGKHRLPLL